MSGTHTSFVLQHIRRLAARDGGRAGDGELLSRFAAARDEEAFAELVRRHGPMVLGVCRRVLRDHHEAEDALQATFLVLARKAGAIRRHESLTSWLYGVAYHLALRARAARRAVLPAPEGPAKGADPLAEVSGRELLGVLDEELARLPAHYRAPLLLCCLEGYTQDEAARRLGWSEGALRGRIDRGRALLRARLTRRGLTLSAALSGTLLIPDAARAALSSSLLNATARAALHGAGRGVVVLADGWLRSLLFARLSAGAALLLAVATLAVGAAYVAQRPPTSDSPAQAAMPPAQEPKSEAAPRLDALGDPLPDGALARLGTTRLRHRDMVCFVGFSAGGKAVVSMGYDGVRVWDAASGRALRHFGNAAGQSVHFGALSPDGKLMATGDLSEGVEIRLWDVADGTLVRAVNSRRSHTAVAFSPDGKLLVALGHDFTALKPTNGLIELWDTTTGELRHLTQGHDGRAWCATFTPDGKTLVTGGADKTIRLWDVATMKPIRQIDGNPNIVGSATLSPDGRLLATVGQNEVHPDPRVTAWLADNRVRLWDVASGKQVRELVMPSRKKNHGIEEGFSGVAFAPDGKTLATTGLDLTVRVWDPTTGKELRQFPGACTSMAVLAFAPDGKALAVASGHTALRVLDPVTGKDLIPRVGHDGHVSAALTLLVGRTVITTGSDGTVRIWDGVTGRQRRALTGPGTFGSELTATADGRTLYLLSDDQSPRAWDVAAGRELRRFAGDRSTYGSQPLALSHDETTLAQGSDKEVRLFDTVSGEVRRTLTGINNTVTGIAFAAGDRTVVAWTSDQIVHFWDVATGRKLRQFPFEGDGVKPKYGFSAYYARLSPDGRLLAYASQNRFIALHDLQTGKVVRRFANLPDGAGPLAFSPDGHCLAWSGWWKDQSVHVIELATGQDRRRFDGHQGRVATLSFAPDGRTLVSGGQDTTALVWNVTGSRTAKAEPPAPDDLDALASTDAARADLAVRRLAATPAQTIPALAKSLKPVAAVDEKRLARLIVDLDADEFAARTAAEAELEKLGDAALPACRKALDASPSPEVRRRLEKIVEAQSPWLRPSPERLRVQRSLEVLERAGTAEARRVLEALAKGLAGAWLTEEAKGALTRLPR